MTKTLEDVISDRQDETMDTVTGQCDHIIGWSRAGSAEVVRLTDTLPFFMDDFDSFSYCPLCGKGLVGVLATNESPYSVGSV